MIHDSMTVTKTNNKQKRGMFLLILGEAFYKDRKKNIPGVSKMR